jgi:hypothetical protein
LPFVADEIPLPAAFRYRSLNGTPVGRSDESFHVTLDAVADVEPELLELLELLEHAARAMAMAAAPATAGHRATRRLLRLTLTPILTILVLSYSYAVLIGRALTAPS